MAAATATVAMLAPMEHELEPLVRRMGLEREGSVHRGRSGAVDVVALVTNIGMAAGARAAEQAVQLGVDRVIVVGIAGGVDRALAIGDVVVPETVVDRATGGVYRPAPLGTRAAMGTLSCGDDLIVDAEALDAMAATGVIAVDMETAAVAAVCESAGCPWSVVRAISDFAGEGLVDPELFALTRPDGTADPDGLSRYLAADPDRARTLTRLAHDMQVATDAAAVAAIESCAHL